MLCYSNIDLDSGEMLDEVRMWYFGRIVRVASPNGEFKATIDWVVGGNETTENLDANKWAGPHAELLVVVGSWMAVV